MQGFPVSPPNMVNFADRAPVNRLHPFTTAGWRCSTWSKSPNKHASEVRTAHTRRLPQVWFRHDDPQLCPSLIFLPSLRPGFGSLLAFFTHTHARFPLPCCCGGPALLSLFSGSKARAILLFSANPSSHVTTGHGPVTLLTLAPCHRPPPPSVIVRVHAKSTHNVSTPGLLIRTPYMYSVHVCNNGCTIITPLSRI